MIYTQLFDRYARGKVVRAGVIGTGQYGTAVVTQTQAMSRLQVLAVADLDLEAARQAFRMAGLSDEEIVTCDTRGEALQALEKGRRVVLSDALLLMDLPLDVIAECTGDPEAGALHAREAIRHGKHVAMVNKEADVTVGPILKYLADRAGLTYTAVDGDQHGLLVGLVGWARELGMEVLCGGKARDVGLIYHEDSGTISWKGQGTLLDAEGSKLFRPLAAGQVAEYIRGRLDVLGQAGEIGHFDKEELTIAANATGLAPDSETLHHPVVRIMEIPEVLCPVEEGGILRCRGAIDMVTCLRGAHEPGMGGGVFIVVDPGNEYSRHIMASKGCIANRRGSAALIYRPYHLCGVETPISILTAALLGLPTGATDYRPRYDVIGRAKRDKKAGETWEIEDLEVLIRPAKAVGRGAPLPTQMVYGQKAALDVSAGSIVTAEMVVAPEGSALWALRREQDAHFLGGA